MLDVFNSEFYTGSASDGSRVEEDFQYGQEVALNQVFNKFLEWDNIASKNNTEGFRKEIPHDFAGHVFIFCWDAHAKTSRLFLTANTLACFRKDQVIMLQNILKDFPEFKGQLVKMVERQAAQKNLFK